MTAPVAPLLTARQRRIIDYIRAFADRNGYCPTIREIADAVHLASPSAVAHQLRQLQAAGWISWVPGRARTLRILNPVDGTDS